MASYATKLNANAASAKRTRSAGTVSAALEYRRQQQALAETAAITAAADTAAGAAAAAIADAAAETDDAGREAVRLATADLQQQYLGGPLGDQALPMQTPLDQDSIAPTRHSEHDGIHDTLPLGSNGAQISGDTGPNEDLEGLQHEQLTGENSDNMYNTANEAASDSKASVSTPLGTSPRQNGAQHHQNGTNGTATASNGQSDGHPTQADGLISAASQTTPPSKAQANGSMPAKEAEVSKQQPARLRDIPAPTLNTSPRIKSALLAAEQYRKQKAAKTAALALAAANAAAAKE